MTYVHSPKSAEAFFRGLLEKLEVWVNLTQVPILWPIEKVRY